MARKTRASRLPATDSLSNLAASLGGGKDKAAADAFFLAALPRDQIEAMYRGDWLARKVVDIVPYDSIREWREWAGAPEAVAAIARTERRLRLRSVVQRAMTLGRLYGGGAVILGTDEEDPAALAAPLYPEAIGPGGLRFLHAVSRWQLQAEAAETDPLDPYFGEPAAYLLAGGTRGDLVLHPSRVVRFLGNPLPDPSLGGAGPWSDSVLQTLYDAIHAVALTAAGTTSLVHEAKVDVVTVPNLSEHLSNAATTAQLSARFSYAAAMKSINNLLLLGDGESWARQRVDFSGLPEMVRTFLQMAAGAADIPVTRLLGQSPAGLSATGESDTRNYYDMIAARQELDLRPQLERLDAFVLRSAGAEPGGVSFAFRPLWQLSAGERAGIALQRAQTTAVYAGLSLWPMATTAALARSQLLADGTYPGAAAAFAGEGDAAVEASSPTEAQSAVTDYSPDQPRDDEGRWTERAGSGSLVPAGATLIRSQFSNPVPAARLGKVAGDPTTGETPDEQEERAVELEQRKERRELDLSAGFKVRSDGGLEAPKLPPIPPLAAEPTRGPGPKPSSIKEQPKSQGQSPQKPAIGFTGRDPYEGQNIPFDPSNLEDKIKNHILNPIKIRKSKFFKINLDIDQSDWRYIADQIKFDKKEVIFDPERFNGNEHFYYKKTKIFSRDGRSVMVRIGFAIKDGIARFITMKPE